MKSKTKIAALAIAAVLATVGVVYAASTFNFQQNLIIPGAAVSYFRADGSTPISNSSDQTAIWTWDAVNNRFDASIILKNTGTVPTGTITATPQPVSGWTITAVPTSSTIPAGGQVTINMQAIPSITTPGTTTGPFTITINIT